MGAVCMIVVGIGWAKPVPTDPRRFKNPKRGMAISAAAGPLANVALAFVSIIAYKLVFYLAPLHFGIWQFLLLLANYMASINITLAVFNLLPVPPFDGSRIVNVFLPQRLYFKVMQYERYIFVAMFVLLLVGAFNTPLAYLRQGMWQLLGRATGFVEVLLGAI